MEQPPKATFLALTEPVAIWLPPETQLLCYSTLPAGVPEDAWHLVARWADPRTGQHGSAAIIDRDWPLGLTGKPVSEHAFKAILDSVSRRMRSAGCLGCNRSDAGTKQPISTTAPQLRQGQLTPQPKR